MGGTSAVGFETINGQVYYTLCGDSVGIMDAVAMFEKGELNIEECEYTTDSVTEFLTDDKLYENEDSRMRIVKRIDGRVIAKTWGMKGYLTYSTAHEFF
jgi:hypothetical protein